MYRQIRVQYSRYQYCETSTENVLNGLKATCSTIKILHFPLPIHSFSTEENI